MTKRTSVKVIVSNGQYETSAIEKTIRYTTRRGLYRRLRQLSREYAVYGDNWAGWIDASIAFASKDDEWGDNQIIGGQWCEPANGWIDLSE